MTFKPGHSGNPRGLIPRHEPRAQKDVVVLARKYTKEAIKCLVSLIRDPNESGAARVKAAEALLSRGWGQAAQQRLDIVAHLDDRELELAAREVLARRAGSSELEPKAWAGAVADSTLELTEARTSAELPRLSVVDAEGELVPVPR